MYLMQALEAVGKDSQTVDEYKTKLVLFIIASPGPHSVRHPRSSRTSPQRCSPPCQPKSRLAAIHLQRPLLSIW